MQALNKEKEKSVKFCLRCAAQDSLKAGKGLILLELLPGSGRESKAQKVL